MADDTTSIDEPAPAAPAAGAGSTSSADVSAARVSTSTPVGEFVRAVSAALLVAACVTSPGSALLLAPFAPAIVAIGLVRRSSPRRLLVTATSASIVFAVLASRSDEMVPAAAVSAVLLALVLALVHARASRRDPIDAAHQSDWSEPRIGSGLTPTIVAWLLAVALVALLALPAAPPVEQLGADAIAEAYAPYADACKPGGSLADRGSFCDELEAQQASVTRAVDRYATELLGVLLAVFAFGAASTAHLIVLARGRRVSDRVRPRWPVTQLELHWSFVYLLVMGLGVWLIAGSGDSTAVVIARSIAAAAATIGSLAIVAQGFGLAAWILAARPRPFWFKAVLVLAFLLATPFMLVMLFVAGMLDLAFHPRRRALAPASD